MEENKVSRLEKAYRQAKRQERKPLSDEDKAAGANPTASRKRLRQKLKRAKRS
jgi:hypothetical protein